jgi:putative PIN family toxin of toxin-antitoxin system
MRVMVDTNVIISAMVFKSSKMSDALRKARDEHELCIAAYSIEETKRILNEKFSGVSVNIDKFFEDYPYTLIESSPDDGTPLVAIRDKNDYPVIHAAITGQIDVLLTGDKDFFDIKIDRPEILLPTDFTAKY